ncbi:MAG: serine protease [Planctomycetaceae bacterium]|nr:serine protease [Planctomycetaceae bacterium]
MHRSTQTTVHYTAMAMMLGFFAVVMSGIGQAQSVCLPLPRLLSISPMGGQVGTSFDATIAAEHMEDPGPLIFQHPGIQATAKVDAQGKPIPNQYSIAIAPDVPQGLYEARLLGRLGISSARIFSVGKLTELNQKPGNTNLVNAMPLSVPSVCNAVVSSRAVDFYSFEAVQGKRYIIQCSARGIDSKLDPVVIVGDANGTDLVAQRTGDTLDFVAKASGKHTIKIHELTFKGGPGYFYRLSIEELPIDAPMPVYPSTRSVSAFSWPPNGLSPQSPTTEQEDAAFQAITLPADISGRFYPAADVDTYVFDAKQGETWWIEVASERLGRPTDPSLVIQMEKPDKSGWSDVAELNDIASPMKPSSNGYAYDGPPFDGGSTDILGKLEIKEAGRYRLLLSDLFGGTRKDPRNIYRLIVRPAQPDFAVVSWGLHMELRNGDRNALSKPLALRAGNTVALEVVTVRRDGFDGEIALNVDGLPQGVTAQGLKIPAGKMRGVLLLSATQDAPQGLANATVTASAKIGEQTVTHPMQMAQMVWPIPDAWGEIPSPRLVSGIPVSVTTSELAPITIASTERKVYEAKLGEVLKIPMTHTLRSEFSGAVLQLKTMGSGFEGNPQFDVSIGAANSEATVNLGAIKPPAGEYTIAFYGSAVAKYRYNPLAISLVEKELKTAQEQQQKAIEQVMQKTQAVASAAVEQKAAADAELADAIKKKQEADALVTAAQEKLKRTNEQASPRDTAEIIITEPVSIRVLAP